MDIDSLLDVLASEECNKTVVKCGNCDKTSAQSLYCFQCCAFWCEDCITGHNVIRENKEHRTLALKDHRNQDVLKRPAFCQRKNHKKEELKFFCEDCEVAICYACTSTDHKGHAKKLLEASNDRKLRAKSAIKSLKQKALERRNVVSKLEQKSNEVHAQVAEVKSKAHQSVDQMIAIIEAKKQDIFKEVDNEAEELLKCLTLKKGEVENQVKIIESAIENIESLSKGDSGVEIQGFNEAIDSILQKQEARSTFDPEGIPCFSLRENKNLLNMLNNEGIGSVITVVSKTKAQKSSVEGNEISEAIAGFEEENLRGNPSEVQVETRRPRPVLSFGQRGSSVGMLKHPWGVTVNDQDQILVTEFGNHRVSVFGSDRNYLRSFGRFGELYYPTGIAYNNGKIFVASRDTHRIQTYSLKGEYLNEFVGLKNHEHQLKHPCGLSVSSDGNIIVADTGNKKIKMFSTSGDFLSEFGGEGYFVDPYHCIQQQKYLVVSDWGGHCIKVCDLNGNFISKIGKEGIRDGEFNHPCLLSATKAGHLMVCDSGNDRVQLFDLSRGKFVAKFGNEDSSIGEFNRPGSTAVLADGRIVVSDCNNHRIQIFEAI